MTARTYNGILVALVPQRGSELVEMMREVARRHLGDGDPRPWTLEFAVLESPTGSVAFRLVSASEQFPWQDGAAADLARLISEAGPGRCWSLAMEKVEGGAEGWAQGVAYDRGERVVVEESQHGSVDLLAWFGEQLALSENEVVALFEICDQCVGLSEGGERFDDEIDRILERARQEFQRYRELKEARKRD